MLIAQVLVRPGALPMNTDKALLEGKERKIHQRLEFALRRGLHPNHDVRCLVRKTWRFLIGWQDCSRAVGGGSSCKTLLMGLGAGREQGQEMAPFFLRLI